MRSPDLPQVVVDVSVVRDPGAGAEIQYASKLSDWCAFAFRDMK